jgi:hypothetical protein
MGHPSRVPVAGAHVLSLWAHVLAAAAARLGLPRRDARDGASLARRTRFVTPISSARSAHPGGRSAHRFWIFWRISGATEARIRLCRAISRRKRRSTEPKVRGSNPLGRATCLSGSCAFPGASSLARVTRARRSEPRERFCATFWRVVAATLAPTGDRDVVIGIWLPWARGPRQSALEPPRPRFSVMRPGPSNPGENLALRVILPAAADA